MTTLIVIVLVVLAAGGAFAAALAISSKKKYAEQNEIVPGTTSGAPKSWAGSHSPEAKLHRKLGDLVKGLRASEMPDDVRLLDARVSIEQQAVAADQYLISVAALPDGEARSAKIAEVAAMIEQISAAAVNAVPAMPSIAIGAIDSEAIAAEVEAARARMAALTASEPALAQQPAPQPGTYTF